MLAAFLGGVVIDLDHIIDCFVYFGRISFKNLLAFPYRKAKKVYLIFHSWELVILVYFFAFFGQSLFWQVFVFSWTLHLLVDNIDGAKKKGLTHYLFFYRFAKGFKIDKLKGFAFD